MGIVGTEIGCNCLGCNHCIGKNYDIYINKNSSIL
jgi:hypothetical protein